MTFYPSPEPLSVIPAPARYDQMLLRAAGIGIGTDSTQTWSIEDAAAFWLPGWKPSGVSETLPADGVMSLATREFLSLFCGLPSIGLLCGALGKLPRFVRPVENMPYEGVLPHGFFYAAHLAFAPERSCDSRATSEHWVSGARCDDQACAESESMLGRCLPRTVFDNARQTG
jgi:hypothetical protein